jgi:hypothetical protein
MEGKAHKRLEQTSCVFMKVGKPLTFKVEESCGTQSTDRWTDVFLHWFHWEFQRERGRCAAPHTSRAQKHVISQSLAPHVNVCCNLCYPCAFISHVWSPFRVCGASLQSIAFGADFMNPKHHIHTRRCVGIAGSIQILGIGLLRMLSRSCLALAINNSRGEAHVPEKSYTFHPKASNALVLRISLANPPFTHMAGHACMKCIGNRNRLCPHTPGTRATLIQAWIRSRKCFIYSKYSRPVSARETDWYRMTSGLSCLCCMALGSFHKLFPSHPVRHARPNHVQ